MRECPSCHREASETARFCPYCGAALPAHEQAAGTEPAPPAGAVSSPAFPGAAVAAPAAPRGKRTGIAVAIVVGVVGLLVLGAVIGLGIATGVHYIKGPLDATNAYINAVNKGDAATAYNLLDPDAPQRRNRSLQEFDEAIVQPATGRLRTWQTGSVNFPDGGPPGRSRANVKVTESLRNGETRDFLFRLEKVGSRWLIIDYYVI